MVLKSLHLGIACVDIFFDVFYSATQVFATPILHKLQIASLFLMAIPYVFLVFPVIRTADGTTPLMSSITSCLLSLSYRSLRLMAYMDLFGMLHNASCANEIRANLFGYKWIFSRQGSNPNEVPELPHEVVNKLFLNGNDVMYAEGPESGGEPLVIFWNWTVVRLLCGMLLPVLFATLSIILLLLGWMFHFLVAIPFGLAFGYILFEARVLAFRSGILALFGVMLSRKDKQEAQDAMGVSYGKSFPRALVNFMLLSEVFFQDALQIVLQSINATLTNTQTEYTFIISVSLSSLMVFCMALKFIDFGMQGYRLDEMETSPLERRLQNGQCKKKAYEYIKGCDRNPKAVEEAVKHLISRKAREIDLANQGIDDVGIAAIAQVLRFSRSLKRLKLPGNEITDSGAHMLSQSLIYCNQLEEVDLQHNEVTAKGMSDLQGARRVCKHLIVKVDTDASTIA